MSTKRGVLISRTTIKKKKFDDNIAFKKIWQKRMTKGKVLRGGTHPLVTWGLTHWESPA
jgi:hypothetical protein